MKLDTITRCTLSIIWAIAAARVSAARNAWSFRKEFRLVHPSARWGRHWFACYRDAKDRIKNLLDLLKDHFTKRIVTITLKARFTLQEAMA